MFNRFYRAGLGGCAQVLRHGDEPVSEAGPGSGRIVRSVGKQRGVLERRASALAAIPQTKVPLVRLGLLKRDDSFSASLNKLLRTQCKQFIVHFTRSFDPE